MRTRYFALLPTLLLLLLPNLRALAQATRVMHETYVLDSVQNVTVQLYDPYQVQFWAGDKAMLKTSVKLYGAKNNVLDYFIKEGRYNIRDTVLTGQLQLVSADQQRATIRAAEGERPIRFHRIAFRDKFCSVLPRGAASY